MEKRAIERTEYDNRFSILLVDDEDRTRKYFKKMLRGKFEILTAPDARSAREILRQKHDRIAVLISDERMPGESGTELLKSTVREYPHIVRIMTTAYSSVDHAVSAINSGNVYRYLLKPWDLDDLVDSLSKAMNKYQTQKKERAQLERRNETRFEAVAELIHDISTPLATLGMLGSFLRTQIPKLTDAYRQAKEAELPVPGMSAFHFNALSTIARSIRNATDYSRFLVKHFLDLRSTSQVDPGTFESISATETVKRAIDLYPLSRRKKEGIFESKLDEDFQYFGSQQSILSVLLNLIKNAVAASSAVKNPTIAIAVEKAGQENRIVVNDNGAGISEDILPHIFNESFSTKYTANKGKGLYFCKQILQAHGGDIVCRSKPFGFTSFIISLPPFYRKPTNER